jgi:hypothetical protein
MIKGIGENNMRDRDHCLKVMAAAKEALMAQAGIDELSAISVVSAIIAG